MATNKFSEYKNQQWIILSKRGRLSPLPNVYSMEAVTTITKQLLNGLTFEKILLTFEKRDMHFLVDKESRDKAEKEGINYLKKNPKIFEQCIKEINIIAKEWLIWLKELSQKDLKELTEQELKEKYLKYREYYKEAYGIYFTVLILERALTKHLEEILKKKTDEKAAAEAFTLLTSTIEAMHGKKEERDRLQLAVQISKNKEWNAVFAKNEELIEKELKRCQELNQKIEQHTENYFWLTRDYEDPILTKKDFMKRIKEILEEKDLERKAQKASEESQEEKKRREALEKELKLTEGEKEFFSIMRTGIYLKELRKSIVSQSLFYFDTVLEEIGRRTSLPLPLVRMLLPEDLDFALLQKKPYQKILEKRWTKSVFVCEEGKHRMYEDKEAEELFQKVLNIDKNVTEIKGLSGAAGVAQGPARIVKHPSDFDKVQEGDIMITVQAVPSFLQTLKKCKALVADGGTGITSHPATLAREVGIPCVVQTKIATEIIHDGDIIEVDGNKGIITIIKRK